MVRKIHLPQLSTSARLGPATLDKSKRTVTVVASTGARGSRGEYDESLDISKVNISRLNGGSAPLLNSHRNQGIEDILGVVERAWVSGENLMATIRLANTSQGDQALAMIEDGTLSAVSIGYRVNRYQDVTQKEETKPHYRAIDWEVFEVSMVGIPFDSLAAVRSINNLNEVEIIKSAEAEGNEMSEALKERQRIQEITLAVRAGKLAQEFADELINSGATVDAARAAVLKKMAESSEIPAGKTPSVEVGTTSSRSEAIENAIAHRISDAVKLTDGGKHFSGLSLVRLAEKYLDGRLLGETDAMLAKRAMTNSDFPLLLGNSANKALQAQYALTTKSYEAYVRRATVRDYKEKSMVRLSSFPSLQQRLEGAEFKYGSMSEEAEKVKVEDFGIILRFSKQMIANDDLSGVARMMSEQSSAAARLEQRLVTTALTTNKKMGDGTVLYHNDHGNIAVAGAIGTATASDAFIKMGAQKSVDGLDILGLRPRFVIVPPSMEFVAKAFFATVNATKTADINPFQNECTVLVDGNLNDPTKYYWVADKSAIETVVLYNIEGQTMPSVETRRRWEDSSLEIKVEYAACAEPMDWRGIVRGSTT